MKSIARMGFSKSDHGNGLFEPNVCTVTFVLFCLIPVAVVVIAVVCSGRNAPGGMVDRFVKAAILRLVGIVVTKVCLPKWSG